jgi:sulfur carrier protein
MNVKVNGEGRILPQGCTVRRLLEALGIDPSRPGIAVAVDGRVVARSAWQERELAEGSCVEIVRPLQGG